MLTKQNYLKMISAPVGKKRIWAIGGGKGGSGKSLIAANLGIQMAEAGCKVTILDFDWGGGNLHTYLGMRSPKKTIENVLLKRVASMADVCVQTSVPNLNIVCAPQEYYSLSGLFSRRKIEIFRQIIKLESDLIIFDLGPGSAFNILDISLFSNNSIIITLPEPSAIENSYLFVKRLIHRKIGQVIKPHGRIDLLTKWTIGRNGHENRSRHIGDFLSYLRSVDGNLGRKVDSALSQLKVKIIINQVRSQDDIKIGNAISYLTNKFIGLGVEFAGYIPFDINVNIAAKKLQPLMIYYPESKVVKGLKLVAKRLAT
jgi:flagellar biosynthesis protein FlhG